MNNEKEMATTMEFKGFIAYNNYKLIEVKDGSCSMEAEITDNSLNPYSMAHGGFIFGLADTAAGVAARSKGRKAVTVNSSIDYLHATRGTKIKAVANCVKDGKTISVYEVSLYDDSERLVAKASVTYFYLD